MTSRTWLASGLLVLLLVHSTAAAQSQNGTAASAAPASPIGGGQPVKVQSGGNGSGTDRLGSSAKNPKLYTLDVTVGERSPDCVSRKVVLINGEFQPPLILTQGDYIEITVKNNIPANAWPSLFEGLSIHWHGFSMKGYAWMDGTKYVSQCPIERGDSFTYKFQVNEMPGTYFYHDHSNLNRADGLQGPLIVKERPGSPVLFEADADETLFLSDWWHFTGNAMALRLNRPFDPTQASSSTGSWCWVGLPKSVLINGQGKYHDCEDPYKRQDGKALPYRPVGSQVQAATKDLLNPPCVAGQLGPTAEPTVCDIGIGNELCSSVKRTELVVESGKTTRVRLVNAATLVYMTVCFEKHTVTIIALDAAPVEPKSFSECVDVNTGQRVDVLLKADQPSDRSYWITVGSQYRKGAPSAYGVLKYSGGSSSAPPAANIISPAAIVDKKWTTDVFNSFKANPDVLKASSTSRVSNSGGSAASAYLAPHASNRESFALPKKEIDQRLILESTQPIVKVNGMLRWALNNVAHAATPPCKPALDSLHPDANWAAENAVDKSISANALNSAAYWGKLGGTSQADLMVGKDSRLQVLDAAKGNADVFIKLNTPSAGTHVLTVQPGEIIEIVIQNDRAGYQGGEYSTTAPLTSNRNGREQHSFHLHGYHFWQVGMGMGAWSPDKVAGYNLVDPPMRDTTTVLFNGTTEDRAAWVAFRFQTGNPGVWPLHCHIDWHMFMGQGINIISDPEGISRAKRPNNMPKCEKQCMLNFGNTNPTASKELVAGMPAPDNGNLPV